MSTKKEHRLQRVLFFLLMNIGNKFDAISLKRFVDYLFILSEKILIHFPMLLSYYINYYDDIIDHEIEIAKLNSSSKILHVGCGSIPASSILLAKKTGASVLGIDKDEYAITYAKTCVKNLNLLSQVDIKKQNALQMNLSAFDVILISQGIIPKKQFLQELTKNIGNSQCIILRSFSLNEELDDQDSFLTSYYSIYQIFHHKDHGSTISIFLQKKNS
jgi:precorrin-6B methylase 2